MIEIIKEQNDFSTTIILNDNNKYLQLLVGGNGDLYWNIHFTSGTSEFIINNENEELYSIFNELYNDIKDINIFDFEDNKEKYIKYNFGNYKELYNPNSNTITWYSDEASHEVANVMKIKKEYNLFRIYFCTQKYIEGYNKDFNKKGYITIRISNSGSIYSPFNIVFMRMYNNLKELDKNKVKKYPS